MNISQATDIISKFDIEGTLISANEFGEGHINTTYEVYMEENGKKIRYVMQKINTNIFTNPERLIDNIYSVTEFLKGQIALNGGDILRETLSLLPTKEGKNFYKNEQNEYFRIYHFIEDATCYQQATKELFYSSAKAFGKFARQLDGFDASGMFDTIEKFHDTVNRYKNFEIALNANPKDRAKDCLEQIEFVKARKEFCSILLDEIEKGEIPLRACHNDTKLNNVMIDNETHEGICVIDLDTVMKGSLLYDVGDSLRFGASSALEDEEDLDKVYFDLEKYEMYIKGYLEETKGILSKKEFEYLAHSGILITLECGMRFLTDHLDGDVYFKIHKENHNLIRAKNQFKLVFDMEQKLDQMIAINEKLYNV